MWVVWWDSTQQSNQLHALNALLGKLIQMQTQEHHVSSARLAHIRLRQHRVVQTAQLAKPTQIRIARLHVLNAILDFMPPNSVQNVPIVQQVHMTRTRTLLRRVAETSAQLDTMHQLDRPRVQFVLLVRPIRTVTPPLRAPPALRAPTPVLQQAAAPNALLAQPTRTRTPPRHAHCAPQAHTQQLEPRSALNVQPARPTPTARHRHHASHALWAHTVVQARSSAQIARPAQQIPTLTLPLSVQRAKWDPTRRRRPPHAQCVWQAPPTRTRTPPRHA